MASLSTSPCPFLPTRLGVPSTRRIGAGAQTKPTFQPVSEKIFPAEPTLTVACSSSSWPVARRPISHVEAFGSGHTENFAVPINGAETTLACTLTPLLVALVLHTQIANVAVRPDLTSLELEKDSTLTQSCGVLCGGVDLVELGVGDGLGDLLLDGLGDGEGDVGLDELSVGDVELLDGDCVAEPEALGVDDGLDVAV